MAIETRFNALCEVDNVLYDLHHGKATDRNLTQLLEDLKAYLEAPDQEVQDMKKDLAKILNDVENAADNLDTFKHDFNYYGIRSFVASFDKNVDRIQENLANAIGRLDDLINED